MGQNRVINKPSLKEGKTMSKHSHAMESFSRLVVAIAGGLAVMGAVAFAFVAFDDRGCNALGAHCRTTAEVAAGQHY